MWQILQAIHRSTHADEFCEVARQKLLRGLTDEEQARSEELFRLAIVESFGDDVGDTICGIAS